MELDEENVSASHRRKRQPDDDLTGEQRLAKRFHLLNLENGRHLYIPTKPPSPGARPRSNAVTESMHVDESKHKVYIHDLDAEIADLDSEEEKLVFLPDIEKRLAQLPKGVLTPDSAPKGNEVVLYSVPESLSVSKEHDTVRRAIMESRKRAREHHSLGGDATVQRDSRPVNGAHRLPAQREDHFHAERDDAMDMG